MKIKFTGKDQVKQDETTVYWFEVDGVGYGISDCNGERRLVDSENYPMIEEGENIRLADTLRTETVKNYISDTYEESDKFLCGDEVYDRDELNFGAIADELEEKAHVMSDYISEMLIVD